MSRPSKPEKDAKTGLTVLDECPNPVLSGWVHVLRSTELQRDRDRFRRALQRVGIALGMAIGSRLRTEPVEVTTPLGSKSMNLLSEKLVLGTALRAGMPLLEGFLEAFPQADVSFFGAARSEDAAEAPSAETHDANLPGQSPASIQAPTVSGDSSNQLKEPPALPIQLGYEAISDLRGRTLLFVDPMIATASTICDIYARLVATDRAPARFLVAGVVGYRGAYDRLRDAIPNVEVWFATADDELDHRSYIVPGLGDAGDLAYGPKRNS